MAPQHKAWRILFFVLAMLAAGTFGTSIVADVVHSLGSYAGLSEIDWRLSGGGSSVAEMTGASAGSPADEKEVSVASDDGRRSSNGVVACLVDSPDGTTKLVFDDVVADGEKNPVRWCFETFFTHKHFDPVALDESRLSDSDYRLIGENLVFRLLALNRRVKWTEDLTQPFQPTRAVGPRGWSANVRIMMVRTKSERLFETFCDLARVRWHRLAESAEQRPDYKIMPNGISVIAEVKQLDANPDEQILAERRARGEAVAFGSVPGERIRREIREANRQVKRLANRKLPALLVVFNNTDCFLHTDPYGVMTAMMGIDEVQVSVPNDSAQSPTFGPSISGKERGMRPDANTTLSAVAVLRGYDDDSLGLDVFHNRFARWPLEFSTLRLSRCRQFRIPIDATNSLGGWEEV